MADETFTGSPVLSGQKAKHLRELGMSDRVIARAVGVSDKTVAKAIDDR